MKLTSSVEWIGAMAIRTALAAQHPQIDDKPESNNDKDDKCRSLATAPIDRSRERINESAECRRGAGEAQPDRRDPEGMAAIVEPFDHHRECRKQKRQSPDQTERTGRPRRR